LSPVEIALILVLFSCFLGLSVVLIRRYPELRSALPSFNRLREVIQITSDYWLVNKKYADVSQVIKNSTYLIEILAVDTADLRKARDSIRQLVHELHKIIHPGQPSNDFDMDTAIASYMLIISHRELADTIKTIYKDTQNVDVIQATNLVIDIAGELVNLNDDLGQLYFQQLVYGINKCLLLVRDKGTDKKTLKKVVSILFRVYKLTKAYRHRRGLKNLSEIEFYKKVFDLSTRMKRLVDEQS
jgi:hypothetical protein